MREALEVGHLRGADLWHVACALFVAGTARSEVAFLSRDAAQRTVAKRLGFPAPGRRAWAKPRLPQTGLWPHRQSGTPAPIAARRK